VKTFKVPVTYSFNGYYLIKAETPEEAIASAKNLCGATLGSGVHSVLNDNMVDWNFQMHTEEKIGEAKRVK